MDEYRNPCWYETAPCNNSYSSNTLFIDHIKAPDVDVSVFRKLSHRMQQTSGKRLRCLPYFYLAGFSKCGSSDLYAGIMRHPQVVRPFTKEPQYWNWNRWKLLRQGHNNRGDNSVQKSMVPVGLKATFSDYVDLFDAAADRIQRLRQMQNISLRQDMITGKRGC